MDEVDEKFYKKPFLAIVVDCATTERISDKHFELATQVIKIDHHPAKEEERGPGLTLINEEASSATEVVYTLLHAFEEQYPVSKKAASYFYTALVGDSGRFQFSSTTNITFHVAGELVAKGIELGTIYGTMYQKKIDDLAIMAYILSSYKLSPKGVAYYVFTKDVLERFHLPYEQGKEHVNLFANITGIKVWCSISEDVTQNCFWVSTRSRGITINKVMEKYRGGGHKEASGGKLLSLDELPNMIADLETCF
jgi:phosphoesterase RecJ-like protein